MSVQASGHHGHTGYKGKGRQCMTNSLSAILTFYTQKPRNWATSDMNNILHHGDEMYAALQTDNYLMLEDIPKELDGFYLVNKLSSVFTGSTLRTSCDNMYYSLEAALTQTLSKPESKAILIVGHSTPSYSCGVLYEDNTFFLFDPHSRSDTGMSTPDGFAIMTEHASVNPLTLFIRHLSATLSEARDLPFEIAELNALVDSSKELDEFDGFSEVSEGEVSCLIYMAQDMSDVSISTVSSVVSEDPILSDIDIEQQLHNDSIFIQSFDDNIFANVDCSNSNCSDGEVESEEQPPNDTNLINEMQSDDCFQPTAEVIVNRAAETDESSQLNAIDSLLSDQGSGSVQDPESVAAVPKPSPQPAERQSQRKRKRIRNEKSWKRNMIKIRKKLGSNLCDSLG